MSEAGSWITLELWNIPWRDDFLDLNSEAFKSAKYIVERAVSFLGNFKLLLKDTSCTNNVFDK